MAKASKHKSYAYLHTKFGAAGADFLFFPLIPLISFFASSRSFLNLIISSITSIINTAFFSCSAHTIALICVIIYRSLILCKTFLLHGWNWHDRYHTFLPLSYICLSGLLSLNMSQRWEGLLHHQQSTL